MALLRFFLVFFIACIPAVRLPLIQATASPAGAGIFVASTPCDASIRPVLNIPLEPNYDFIRWELQFQEGPDPVFELQLQFGEAMPNTLGFKKTESRSFKGRYRIRKGEGPWKGEVYQLELHDKILLLTRLNENLLHILSADHQLLRGNGGWSYTLNRKPPVNGPTGELSPLRSSSYLTESLAREVVFEGRTPCNGLEKIRPSHQNRQCLKLKWKITLYRDSLSRPSTFVLNSTLSRTQLMAGTWTIVKSGPPGKELVICQLKSGHLSRPVFLWLADAAVLFFLDETMQPYTGNENFSYTLNKR